MRADFDGHRDVWGPLLTIQLRSWAEMFFKPVAQLRASGLFQPATLGPDPPPGPTPGLGVRFSSGTPEINLLDPQPTDHERMHHFDLAAEEYVSAVGSFTGPVLGEVLRLLDRDLPADARLLDVSCGPGDEAVQLASLVPAGEVVAVDLSVPTLREAFRIAGESGTPNVVFHQCDAEVLRGDWDGAFDIVVCALSLHFYDDARAAVKGFHRVLRPGGRVYVAEPGTSWLNDLSAPLVRMANPALVRYRSADELRQLFDEVGFGPSQWSEVLPGIGVLVAPREGGPS
ncbi:MAG: class I SAM-dependent methyltransferase [Thermoanaerobaculia bacterium]